MADSPVDLDRRAYRRVVAAATTGTFVEVYDLLIYGYFASVLAEQFFPRQDPTAALLSTFAILALGSVVRPAGAVIFGHVGDRLGRRTALVASVLLMSGSTMALGLLPTYHTVGILAPVLLLVCRVLQGLSASGELTGANVLVFEHAPSDRRGRAVSIVNVAGNVGALTAAATGFALARSLEPEQLATWGWRLAFLVASLIGLVGLYVRTRVLDSPVFVALGDAPKRDSAPIVRTLRTAKRRLLVLTVWTAAASLGGFMLVGFLPSYLIRVGRLSPADAFAANGLSIIVLGLSTMLGGYLVDRYPVRRVAIGVVVGAALAAVPAFLLIVRSGTFAGALIGQSLWAMFLGASGMLGAVLSMVLFPVPIRFTGTALASNLAVALVGSSAPYVSASLIAATGSPVSPAIYVVVVTMAALLAAIVGLPSRSFLRSPGIPHGPADPRTAEI
ncbi:MFS transporter [Actinoplanes sp. ATCC 53533]|uniref:MFS transporter n=1 Tax=Actinoplanes sp. ATCC 53533 TaxID=1288362 RepID=UPI00131503CD|nr:MFS transporter [Actinoplanes sp. ATCC 53533]